MFTQKDRERIINQEILNRVEYLKNLGYVIDENKMTVKELNTLYRKEVGQNGKAYHCGSH